MFDRLTAALWPAESGDTLSRKGEVGSVIRRLRDRLRGFWHDGLPPNSAAAYLFAAGCIGIAILVRLVIGFFVGGVGLFTIYFPAVLVSSLIGGPEAGTVALMLGGIAGWVGFSWPTFGSSVPTLMQGVGVLAYLVSGAFIVWIADSHRHAIRRLRAEEAQRRLLLRELQHRSANTLAVVQAIVSQSLRSNRAEAQKIVSRIGALAATNDLLTNSVAQTADLRDILQAELKPHGEARIAIQGETVALAPELARALALVFHELTTNAAKYGALSRPEGRLLVRWRVLGDRVRINWIESGGPPVAPTYERGFGMTLLESALGSYQGAVEIDFRSDGVVCDISFTLPGAAPRPAFGAAGLPASLQRKSRSDVREPRT
jgi:two-component sensor histidine kinase